MAAFCLLKTLMNHKKPAETPRRQLGTAVQVDVLNASGINRWYLLDRVKALRSHFGLNDRDITVLNAHLSVLPKGLLQPGALNMSYMKVQDILERANGMDEKSFRRSELRLVAAGLVVRKLSANGRRFPVYKDNAIVTAYGIDLSPLVAMSGQLDDLIADIEAQDQERRALRTMIRCELQDRLRALEDFGGKALAALEAFMNSIRNILRRKSTSITELEEIAAKIAEFDIENEAPCPARTGVQHNDLSDKMSVDDGQSVRHIESQEKDFQKKSPPQPVFNASRIRIIWGEAPALSDLYPDVPVEERQLAKILFEFSSFMGLRKETVSFAAVVLGWEKMALCLNYLEKQLNRVANPDAYLKSMIRSYDEGQSIAAGRISKARDVLSGCQLVR